ncbi:MAG: hypothetical protein AAGL24_11480 [Pseudomonadota bacterium]
MIKRLAWVPILVGAALVPSARAADCEADARAAMLDFAHPVPMRQDVTTEMAGQQIKSAALSTPDRRGMALDANGNPVSLWDGGRFYTTTDGGTTWSLLQEQSAEVLAAQDANFKKQADQARDSACEYDVDLEGKAVHRFSLAYEMIPSGTPVESTYWVDAQNGFPWQVVHAFGGANPSTITQRNSPEPDLQIPVPDR